MSKNWLYGSYIEGGDWDQREASAFPIYYGSREGISTSGLVEFEDYPFYQSVKERYRGGKSWKDTAFYDWVRDDNDDLWYYRSPKIVDERLSEFDKLVEDMRRNGYKTQCELLADGDEEDYNGERSLSDPDDYDRPYGRVCNNGV